MRSIMRHCAPALISLIAVGSVHAQGLQRPWAACDNLSGEGSPASVVAGCTTVIDDGKSAPEGLASAYRNRGAAYRSLGDAARSLADFGEAIRLAPRDAALFYSRGNVHAAQRNYERALADYDEAIRLDPAYPQAYNNRGGVYHNQKSYDRALADFDKALAIDPDYPAALSNRCAVRAALKQDLDKAMTDCGRSLRLRPNHLPTLDTRGLVDLLRRDYPAALTDYDAVLRVDDEAYGALYGRGLAQLGLGRTEAGRADIARASAGDPTVAAYYEVSGLRP